MHRLLISILGYLACTVGAQVSSNTCAASSVLVQVQPIVQICSTLSTTFTQTSSTTICVSNTLSGPAASSSPSQSQVGVSSSAVSSSPAISSSQSPSQVGASSSAASSAAAVSSSPAVSLSQSSSQAATSSVAAVSSSPAVSSSQSSPQVAISSSAASSDTAVSSSPAVSSSQSSSQVGVSSSVISSDSAVSSSQSSSQIATSSSAASSSAAVSSTSQDYVTTTAPWTGTVTATTTVPPSGTVPGTVIIQTPQSYITVSTVWTGTVTATTTVPPSGTVPGTVIVQTPQSYITTTTVWTGIQTTTTTVPPSGTVPGTVIVQTPLCSPGLGWAYYNLTAGNGPGKIPFDPNSTWDLDTWDFQTVLSGQTPQLNGSTSIVGLNLTNFGNPANLYGNTLPANQTQNFIVQHIGYWHPTSAGNYNFTMPQLIDDGEYLWFYSQAVSGFTNKNAYLYNTVNTLQTKSFIGSVAPSQVGLYIPFRLAFVAAQGRTVFPFQVQDPTGKVILSQDVPSTDGQFINSCQANANVTPISF